MRKLKLQVQMSVDGYVAGPNGELDWMVWDWDDELQRTVGEITDSVGTILLGRNMAGGFISHWSNVVKDPNNAEYLAAKKFVDTPKVVFSKTLVKSEWENTSLAAGSLAEEVASLKAQQGNDIIVYGGASFVAALIKERLIDDFYLFINPTALGEGLAIFKDVKERQRLALVNAVPFDCGIVLLHYEKLHSKDASP